MQHFKDLKHIDEVNHFHYVSLNISDTEGREFEKLKSIILDDEWGTNCPDFHYRDKKNIYYCDDIQTPDLLIQNDSPSRRFNLVFRDQKKVRCGNSIVPSTEKDFLRYFNKKKELFYAKQNS